ncbi:unnamed protein product, partial [Discosporangium mesarthrocarpum]
VRVRVRIFIDFHGFQLDATAPGRFNFYCLHVILLVQLSSVDICGRLLSVYCCLLPPYTLQLTALAFLNVCMENCVCTVCSTVTRGNTVQYTVSVGPVGHPPDFCKPGQEYGYLVKLTTL